MVFATMRDKMTSNHTPYGDGLLSVCALGVAFYFMIALLYFLIFVGILCTVVLKVKDYLFSFLRLCSSSLRYF